MVMNGRLSCTAETRAQDAVIVIEKRDCLHRNIQFSKIMLKAKKTICFFVALFALISFSEYLLLRCPSCGKRPSKPFMRLDDECQQCGGQFELLEK
jgi:hypothetical protein